MLFFFILLRYGKIISGRGLNTGEEKKNLKKNETKRKKFKTKKNTKKKLNYFGGDKLLIFECFFFLFVSVLVVERRRTRSRIRGRIGSSSARLLVVAASA